MVLLLCVCTVLTVCADSQAWAAEAKAYALLYDNGTDKTLVLQRGNTPETAKYGSLVSTYSDIEAESSYCKWQDDNATRIVVRDALHPTTMTRWFANAEKIEGLNNLDTSNVTQMECLFYGCEKIASLNLSRFNTAKVENMRSMFSGCRALRNLDLSNFNTSRVADMTNMFYDCVSLSSVNLSSFNTSNVPPMMGMFGNCHALEHLDVSGFDTSSATNMRDMFGFCLCLTTLDVSHFNTSRVENMHGMFSRCDSLASLDVSRFDTSQVVDMEGMFNGCKRLARLDLSSFNTSKVREGGMRYMLTGCTSLTHLTFGSRWSKTLNDAGLDYLNRTWYTPTGSVADLSARPTAGTYTTISSSVSPSVEVTSVKVNAISFALGKIGATRQLTATVYPANASNKTITWTSSDTRVATVTSSGLVKAVGRGSAVITARTANGKTAPVRVTVNVSTASKPQPASVKIDQGAFTLAKKSASKQLSATVAPSNASNKTVTWSSSNTKVAKVSSSGKVTPVANGAAYITAKTSNGKTAKVKVTVKIVYPTKVSITTKSFTLTKKGATKTVKYSLSGKGVTDKTVKWSSSNTKVAKVSSSGKVTAVGNGSATITVKTANGKTAKVKVTVKIPSKTVAVSSVSLNSGSFTLTKKGATKVLKATVKPSNATKKTVTWSSSNKKVATVSSSGKVTAVGNGSATITAKTSNGKYAQVKVTVKIAAASSKPTANQTARDIFNQYNAYRKSKGLKQVAWDDKLAAEALKSAKECQRQGRLVHTVGKRNRGLSDILQYASQQVKGSEAVTMWKNSAAHRKMMQCTTATRAGVAAYKGSNDLWYYAIVYNYTGSNQDGS